MMMMIPPTPPRSCLRKVGRVREGLGDRRGWGCRRIGVGKTLFSLAFLFLGWKSSLERERDRVPWMIGLDWICRG